MATTTIYNFVTRLRPIMIIALAKNTSIGYNDTPMSHLTRRKQSLIKSSINKSLFFVGSHFKKIDKTIFKTYLYFNFKKKYKDKL
tara:strand:+ start:536 stop:790 length:255 start_codon:yes stop_codon:yes gene_type:complete